MQPKYKDMHREIKENRKGAVVIRVRVAERHQLRGDETFPG